MMTSKLSQLEQVQLLTEFLEQHFEFRLNVLSGKMEVRSLCQDTYKSAIRNSTAFRPLTKREMNSISLAIRNEGLEISNLKTLLDECINSSATPLYDPINEYLEHLPKWDGHDYVNDLFNRIPEISSEHKHFLSIWLRSTVAHWMGMDTIHGNECVATLIGDQGCGKSTWCVRLLPPELRCYYLDHINMSNKFDKEMALTNNLIVNIDELDQVKKSQQSELKHTLSKNKVNGRIIFTNSQEDRRRYASFVATTNNTRPLMDPTGSRRFLCIRIPSGKFIDNDTEINYEQLYAQVLYQLREEKQNYWFTNEEVKRLQELNFDYQHITDIPSMIDYCFRHPEKDEKVIPMSGKEVTEVISRNFNAIDKTLGSAIKIGLQLKKMEFASKRVTSGLQYYLVKRQNVA